MLRWSSTASRPQRTWPPGPGTCPGSNESAGRVKSTATRPGNTYLKAALGAASLSVSHTQGTYFSAKYKRIAAWRGPNKALVAVERHLDRDLVHGSHRSPLAGVALLQVGLGPWELCVGDLALTDSLATHTFDELGAKVAGTLVLVLVVRFLEQLVQSPEPERLVATGVSITLVGGRLMVFMRWRR